MELETSTNVAQYLETLKPGFIPKDIFLQFARLMVVPVIELVPVRINAEGKAEILLVQRESDDPVWPNMWHVSGTVIRATDKMDTGNDYDDPLKRLLAEDGELAGVDIVGKPVQIETERRRVARGDELAVIFYVEVSGEAKEGRFFPLEGYPHNVPEPGIVPHHDAFVRRAAERFLSDKAS
jgi:hypothetical protein